MEDIKITVEITVNASIDKVWKYWNETHHIDQWYFASDDWHCPNAENNFEVGGEFKTRMEEKNGNFGFDFSGTYDEIIKNRLIRYHMLDGRKASIQFVNEGKMVKITEQFDADLNNPIEIQKAGWQAILSNFKKHVEKKL